MIKDIDLIVGARPNFIKAVVLYKVLKREGFKPKIVHTGQHYSNEMSDSFFKDLKIPAPDFKLNVGSHSHAVQTSKIMIEYEKTLLKRNVDLVMVFGDVNSTIAAALTAKKLHKMVCHVEAGLRSFDRDMPEEINRLATDAISDLLLAPSEDAVKNLLNEGVPFSKIKLVGNVMIDTLKDNMKRIKSYDILGEFGLKEQKYYYVTLHRPSNVDEKPALLKSLLFLNKLSEDCEVVFPIHPRTLKMIETYKLKNKISKNIKLLPPQPYLKSIALELHSKAVVTDSGGIQEETSYLNVPCYTLRNSTERPITVKEGTNMLITADNKFIKLILNSKRKPAKKIKYWDGKAAERIVNTI